MSQIPIWGQGAGAGSMAVSMGKLMKLCLPSPLHLWDWDDGGGPTDTHPELPAQEASYLLMSPCSGYSQLPLPQPHSDPLTGHR